MGTQRPYRKLWWGYTDIGAIQIPPNPQYLILTDRTTGKLWWITFNAPNNTADGFGYIAINDTFPCNAPIDGLGNGPQTVPPVRAYNNCSVFAAYAEPIIGFLDAITYARLIVDNAQLGVSVETFNQQLGIDPNAPPINLVRDTGILGFNGEFTTIILSMTSPGWYAWVPTILTQTPNPPATQTYD